MLKLFSGLVTDSVDVSPTITVCCYEIIHIICLYIMFLSVFITPCSFVPGNYIMANNNSVVRLFEESDLVKVCAPMVRYSK